jgi:hypothetical protein
MKNKFLTSLFTIILSSHVIFTSKCRTTPRVTLVKVKRGLISRLFIHPFEFYLDQKLNLLLLIWIK